MNAAMESFQKEKEWFLKQYDFPLTTSDMPLYVWIDLKDAIEFTRFPKIEFIADQMWSAIYWTDEEMAFHNNGLWDFLHDGWN